MAWSDEARAAAAATRKAKAKHPAKVAKGQKNSVGQIMKPITSRADRRVALYGKQIFPHAALALRGKK
jgi:hypothetical protein